MSRLALILSFAFLMVFPAARAAAESAGKAQFHPPQTEAEKALDKIVKIAVSRPDMFQTVLQNPKYDLSKTKDFESLFTDVFLGEWRKFEKDLVNQYCGGKYRPDKDCGYDINPISCQIHGNTPYFYRTVIGDDGEAVVTLATSNDITDNGVYYMKREKGAWKMGGLYCEHDIPDTTPSKALVKKFLPPKRESEKKLESILHQARTDKRIIPFIFNLAWRNRSKDLLFSSLFTPALLNAWHQQAHAIINHNCSQEYYRQGSGGCDFSAHPVTCLIGEDDFLIARKTAEKGRKSTITYSYPGGHPQLRFIYHMLKDKDSWKIDGIDCDDNRKFNMP